MLFRKKRAIVLDTNILLYWAGKFKGFLKYLKKIKGEVFIPWAVQVELSTMAYKSKTKDEKWRTATPKEKEELKRQAKKRILSKKELNLRERNQLAVRAYPFAQEQAEKGNWKLVGRDEEIEFYRKGIAEIEKKIQRSDTKILATCLLLADKQNFKEVVLFTRDKGLQAAAKRFSIQIEKALSNVI